MKKSAFASTALLALGTVASLLPTLAQAEDSPISYNVGAVSDYRYRGISQTALKPALQGGVDYAKGPVYFGTWLSTISWIKDAGKLVDPPADTGSTPIEWDIYGGSKGEIAKDLSYDVGVLGYIYLGNKYSAVGDNANTGELYGALTYGPATLKYSYALTSLFGFPDSSGSGYIEAAASFDLGKGFSLAPHIGHQTIKKNGSWSYSDYSLTLGKDFGGGFSGSLAVIGTDADKALFISPSNKFLGKTMAVLGVKYAF